jgi:phosphohistidine phosphatase SixA
VVKGLVELLPKPSECICVVQQKPATSPRLKGQLIEPTDWTAEAIALAVSDTIEARPALDVEEVLVVGHDIYTGDLAVDCCVRLQARMGRTLVKSAVVSHMDWVATPPKP